MSAPRFERRFIGLVRAEGPDAAEKMQRLAGIAEEMGGVAITASAYEQEFPALSEAEQERQRRIDGHIHYMLSGTKGSRALEERIVKHGGIRFIRDLLVLGRAGTERTARLTAHQHGLLASVLADQHPNEPYMDDPSPADVAQVCVHLDQVHAGVIPSFWNYLEVERYGTKQRMTVDQIFADNLRLPSEYDLRRMRESYNHTWALIDAHRFAAAFLEARATSQS